MPLNLFYHFDDFSRDLVAFEKTLVFYLFFSRSEIALQDIQLVKHQREIQHGIAACTLVAR